MCLSRIDSGEAAEEGVAVVTPSKSPSDKTSSIKIQNFQKLFSARKVLSYSLRFFFHPGVHPKKPDLITSTYMSKLSTVPSKECCYHNFSF